MHVLKFESGGPDLQGRLVVVGSFCRRAIEDFKKNTYTKKSAVEFDIEPGEPLGGFVGQKERGDEREELTGCGAGLDHAISAIGDSDRDRAAAQRLHQRARAVRNARHLVGLVLHGSHVLIEAFTHDLLQRECLDDADALNRLLQRLYDARPAVELSLGNGVDATNQLAQHEECRRSHDEAEERH